MHDIELCMRNFGHTGTLIYSVLLCVSLLAAVPLEPPLAAMRACALLTLGGTVRAQLTLSGTVRTLLTLSGTVRAPLTLRGTVRAPLTLSGM